METRGVGLYVKLHCESLESIAVETLRKIERLIELHVISRKTLREFWQKHPQAKAPLEQWYKVAKRAKWKNLAEVKLSFPYADLVGECTVFNIKGNDYRLITKIVYRVQRIYIRFVLTHSEYDTEVWKNDCGD